MIPIVPVIAKHYPKKKHPGNGTGVFAVNLANPKIVS